jgi:hypothetical protein
VRRADPGWCGVRRVGTAPIPHRRAVPPPLRRPGEARFDPYALATRSYEHLQWRGFVDKYGWLTAPIGLRATTGGRDLGEPVKRWHDEAGKVRDLAQTLRDARGVVDGDHGAPRRLWGRFHVVDDDVVIFKFGEDN